MVESGGNTHHSHHVRTVASAEDYPLERLADPCNDRVKADVPRPPRYPMNVANLYEKQDGKFGLSEKDLSTFMSLPKLDMKRALNQAQLRQSFEIALPMKQQSSLINEA